MDSHGKGDVTESEVWVQSSYDNFPWVLWSKALSAYPTFSFYICVSVAYLSVCLNVCKVREGLRNGWSGCL